MTRGPFILSMVCLLAIVAMPRISQAQAKDNDVTKSELKNFDAYLDQHQDVRAQLEQNPKLLDDPAYVNKHPHLKDFLEHHPNTREEVRENPNFFMHRENTYERNAESKDITKSELRNWDDYLDKHPDVQRDLSKNPKLIDDPAYVNKHPHLKEYLEKHPNTREQLAENPQMFSNREKHYEKAEDKKPKK
jgi:uncharacterized protein YlxP (DUF503 family)